MATRVHIAQITNDYRNVRMLYLLTEDEEQADLIFRALNPPEDSLD